MANEWWVNNVPMEQKEEANNKNKRRKIDVDDHCRVAVNFSDWECMMMKKNMTQVQGLGCWERKYL